MALTDDELQRLADRLEILDVVDGIDNAVDEKDWPRCRNYFTDEIFVDFSSLGAGDPGPMAADDLVVAWQSSLVAERPTFHLRGNHVFEIDGDSARVRSKAYATNILRRELGESWWDVLGHYLHTLERTAAGWKCTGMSFFALHGRGNEQVRLWQPET